MRSLCALQLTRPEKLIDAFDALYRGMWVERKPIHKPEVYTDILTTLLGEETAKEVLTKVSLMLLLLLLRESEPRKLISNRQERRKPKVYCRKTQMLALLKEHSAYLGLLVCVPPCCYCGLSEHYR